MEGDSLLQRNRRDAITLELLTIGVSHGGFAWPQVALLATADASPNCASMSLGQVDAPATWDPVPIYFDSDSTDLSLSAERILRFEFVAYRPGRSHIVIDSYDDTAGSVESSMIQSERRGEAVRRKFAEFGARWEDIEVHAHGEMGLARPTADGVVETLNRRIEFRINQLPPFAGNAVVP